MDHKLQIDRHRFLQWLSIGIGGFLLLCVFFMPPNSFVDRPVVMASYVALMVYGLIWDEKSQCFRLPFRLPDFLVLAIPLGLVTLTVLRTQWSSPGAADRIRWVNGFGVSLFYLGSFLRSFLRWRANRRHA